MDRETARQTIRSQVKCTDYLTKSKSGLYECPFCGSGTGQHRTGALKVYDTNTWTCHACHKSGDVIDLYMNKTGADYNTALQALAEETGVTIDPYRPTAAEDFAGLAPSDRAEARRSDFNGQGNINTPRTDKSPQNGAERATGATPDFMRYYEECRQYLNDPAAVSYLTARGISPETAKAYWIGYDPKTERIVIPVSKSFYVARAVDSEKEPRYLNPKGGKPTIFNERVLYAQDVQEIFVCEGAFDALSVIEAGATAIALNSASNANTLIKKLEQRRTEATLILCLDNDDRGKAATEKIREGLRRLNIGFIVANISAGYKDPNEALTGNRSAFIAAVEDARRQTAAKPDNTAYYIDNLMNGDIDRFKDDKKTGFANLDANAGGLYAGLYVLAAISSLGKTTFALQLADQLAEQGHDVIFFSLEQSKLELVSKSLARRTAQKSIDAAVTSLSIRKGHLPRRVLDAAQEYKNAVADRISIIEGNFSCNISFIGDKIRQYVRRTGTRPVVFIDYLQILQPEEDTRYKGTKETVDAAVRELKRISVNLNLTMIVISSVNRQNYMQSVDFESLKESGSIEYTADVVWGLQLRILSDDLFTTDKKGNTIEEKRKAVKEAKVENPRKIELCCLKNRYGKSNYSCYFDYYPINDLFVEAGSADPDSTKPDFKPAASTWGTAGSSRRKL